MDKTDEQKAEEMLGQKLDELVTFADHKERTANDCEQVAKILTDLATISERGT